MANNKDLDRKLDSAKLNVEVCSIFIAAISISFGLSDLSLLFQGTRFFAVIFMGSAVMLLVIAIIVEADAVYCYSRGLESDGDYFDERGYKLMKYALLSSLITVVYLASPLFPSIIELPNFWSQLTQATSPMVPGVVSFVLWRIFKVRKLGRKWYSIG